MMTPEDKKGFIEQFCIETECSKCKAKPLCNRLFGNFAPSDIDADYENEIDLLFNQLIKAYSFIPDNAEGYEIRCERKSRRVNLLIRPTIYEEIKNRAKKSGRSTNDYINYILAKTIRKSKEKKL